MALPPYTYHQFHVLASSENLADYPVKFVVYKSSGTSSGNAIYCNNHCKDDFSDVRFTVDGTTALSQWVQTLDEGTSAEIWVKIPSIFTSQVVCILYGDATATDPSDGESVFLFFDDFSSETIDTTKWDVFGSPTVEDGSLFLTTGGQGLVGKSAYSLGYSGGSGYAVCFSMSVSSAGTMSPHAGFMASKAALLDALIVTNKSTSTNAMDLYCCGQDTAQTARMSASIYGSYHTYDIRARPTDSSFYVDGNLTLQVTTADVIPRGATMYPTLYYGSSSTPDTYVDYIFVRPNTITDVGHSVWYPEADGTISIDLATYETIYSIGVFAQFSSVYSISAPGTAYTSVYSSIAGTGFEAKYSTNLGAAFEAIYSLNVAQTFMTIIKGAGVSDLAVFRTRIRAARERLAPIFDEV